MKSIALTACGETWPLKEPFRISRGVRTEAKVVLASLAANEQGLEGRGEGYPYPRYGESVESVLAQIEQIRVILERGAGNDELQSALPAGAARNAVDCALWDLRCKELGVSSWQLLKRPKPAFVETAITIGIGSADEMAEKAAAYSNYPLLKIKLDREDVRQKVMAVRNHAPGARIVIDPNESWDLELLRDIDGFLADQEIAMLEQPLPAAEDHGLATFQNIVPICADESCHTRTDLDGLLGKYQVINIKLDKTGGLTEALALKTRAQEMGFGIMVGCMVSTSLAMAPALLLAGDAAFVDLDGPVWMAKDREHGLVIREGAIDLSSVERLWGGGTPV